MRTITKNFLVIFVTLISYGLGWFFYLLEAKYLLYMVFFLFLYINIGKILNEFYFKNIVLKPIIFGMSSAFILLLLNYSELNIIKYLFVFIIVLMLLTNESNFKILYANNDKSFFKKMIFPLFFPFSITYLILILRLDGFLTYGFLILFYFTCLYLLSHLFDKFKYFLYFAFTQVVFCYFLFNQYLEISEIQLAIFFLAIYLFMLINFWREGLLLYLKNNIS